MGPRSSDRGNALKECGATRLLELLQWGRDHLIAEMIRLDVVAGGQRWLQWGRDHLIAEIRRCRSLHGATARLQWGRDHLIAEMRVRQRRAGEECMASMGPRSSDRGNADNNAGAVNFGITASMGPRSSDRGNAIIAAVPSSRHGRFNGAAII